MSFRFCIAWLITASVALSTPPTSQVIETNDFTDAVTAADGYVQQLGPRQVLLVVDIDNTLLAMRSSLGSDQWFEWQEHLLANDPDSDKLVAKDFDGLLRAQGRLFSLGSMRLTDPRIPGLIGGLQEAGVSTLVLTSRGPEFRSATERELARNGLRFRESSLPLKHIPLRTFKPYSLEELSASGLTQEEAAIFRLGRPRDTSYSNGVFMTSGQHKGAMLLGLLNKSRLPIGAVVFVDDHGKHVTHVYDALTRRGIAVTAVHYQREDSNVKRFRYGDKAQVVTKWRKLDLAIEDVFAPKDRRVRQRTPSGLRPDE